MLLAFWERLRGYDKWVEVEAAIEQSDVTERPIANRWGEVVDYERAAGDLITWTDQTGEKQYAAFTVEEASKLYLLVDGQTVTIRYDPAHPDHFYYRDLLRSRVARALRTALWTIAVLALLILAAWARLN